MYFFVVIYLNCYFCFRWARQWTCQNTRLRLKSTAVTACTQIRPEATLTPLRYLKLTCTWTNNNSDPILWTLARCTLKHQLPLWLASAQLWIQHRPVCPRVHPPSPPIWPQKHKTEPREVRLRGQIRPRRCLTIRAHQVFWCRSTQANIRKRHKEGPSFEGRWLSYSDLKRNHGSDICCCLIVLLLCILDDRVSKTLK